MSVTNDNGQFIKIAITHPYQFPGESEIINNMLLSGKFDYVHIRKPDYDYDGLREIINHIDPSLYPKIKIHSHFSLIKEFPGLGVHLNSRSPEAPLNATSISKSFHTLEELIDSECYNYVTLSPIFDSISKPGYLSAFNLSDLKDIVAGRNIIALGGVTEDKIPLLKDLGFYGCAMLGAAWKIEDKCCI